MIDPLVVEELIDRALAEDIGFCDLTSELVIPADARAELALNARQDIVVAGIDVAAQVFRRRVPQCRVELRVKDGERVRAGTAMGGVEGPARGLLAVERTALNFLQHLSGVATLTAQYAERIARTRRRSGPDQDRSRVRYARTGEGGARGGGRHDPARQHERGRAAQGGRALGRPGSARGLGRGAARDHPGDRRDRRGFHFRRPDHAVGAGGGHRLRCRDQGPLMTARSVCLFCSALEDLPEAARELAADFGAACAARGLRLVYGGSGRGLMGIAARAAAAAGGEVLGIMPRHLIRPERAADNIGTLLIVDSLAERKQRMTEAADLFVALPGGIGTLNELIEMLTLNDLRLQDKPVILCANDGFWQPFVTLIERFRAYGVLRPSVERRLRAAASVEEAMRLIEDYLSSAAQGTQAAASRSV